MKRTDDLGLVGNVLIVWSLVGITFGGIGGLKCLLTPTPKPIVHNEYHVNQTTTNETKQNCFLLSTCK